MATEKPFIVSASPHIHSGVSIRRIMWFVVLALVPAGAWGIYAFGAHSAWVVLCAVLSAVATEAGLSRLCRRPVTVSDGSAVITGMLLAYSVPPQIPIWMICIGSAFAIAVGKYVFGGLGHNIFNPALVGRAFLMAAWPTAMVTWTNPRWWPDAVSSATPLAIVKSASELAGAQLHAYAYADLFIGNRGGCIGEICIIGLLIGAAFLLATRVITWEAPVAYLGTVAVFSRFTTNGGAGTIVYQLLGGGLMLGAWYMATDYVTTPLTRRGQLIFGIGCGVLTVAIRKWGGYPEGVCYSILIMNAAAPLIDRFVRPRTFGATGQAGRT